MSEKSQIHILNGPNLNLLGAREAHIYGSGTLADIEKLCRAKAERLGFGIVFFQTNHEGALIDAIQKASADAAGIVLNAASLSHTSIGVLDAVRASAPPVIEVHLSNIYAREPFRRRSLLSGAAEGVICGLGATGYAFALEALAERLKAEA